MTVRTDALTIANLLLLLLFPAAWLAPLAEASVLPLFGGTEISILGGVVELWEDDPALAALVALFAVVMPYAKTLTLAAIHFGRLGLRPMPLVELLGKLSMADVFLIAVYIVVVKGTAFASIESQWGLWLFTICVLVSMLISHLTKKRLLADSRVPASTAT